MVCVVEALSWVCGLLLTSGCGGVEKRSCYFLFSYPSGAFKLLILDLVEVKEAGGEFNV